MSIDTTVDGFLNGRIRAAQPRTGFRAGHDTVLLAASVPPGKHVLELGSGAGIASLCYGFRIAEANVTGIEIDPGLVAIANANAARNRLAERVRFLAGDIHSSGPIGLFDHVFFNPPFHIGGTPSPVAARNQAKQELEYPLSQWANAALRHVRPGGTVTAIVRFDRRVEILGACAGTAALVLPLYPRAGAEPRRAILQIMTGVAGPVRDLPGLVLHQDGGNTAQAEAVLREGLALPFPHGGSPAA